MYFNLMGETFPTTVNGPGNRYMIHLQGCTLGCTGCFNPESWSRKINENISVYELAYKIKSHNPDGLTISGGEPFQQIESLYYFLEYLHKDYSFPKGILIYSGYYEEELTKMKRYEDILNYVDVIVSGRFDQTKRIHNSLLSSSNQKFIWGARGQSLINENELNNQDFEVIIEKNALKLTGFADLSKKNKQKLKELGVEISCS